MVTRLTTVAIAALTLIGGGMMAWVYPVPTMATSVTEPTNPFGWSDLAESLASNGDVTGAREAFAQSVRLGPKVPPILIRVVNFEVANGKLEHAVPQIRHILELTNVYDNLVFRYLSRSGMESARILAEVIPDPGRGSVAALAQRTRTAGGHASAPEGDGRPKGDAARAWAAYLLSERRPEAEAVYEWLQERGAVTAELRNRWVEYLVIVRKQYARAVETWAAAQIEPGYPAKNRVFDGRFVRPRTQGRLDWTVTAHAHVEAKMGDGLTLRFDGMENTAYGHLTQQTFLPAGRWRFTAEAEANGLTTDQRPYFRIYDTFDPRRLDASTVMTPERMAVDLTAPPGGSWITIVLLRRQSEKFDNKIQGTLRVREVRIAGLGQ